MIRFIGFFVVITVKDNVNCWLYELLQTSRVFFKQGIFIHPPRNLLIVFVLVSLFLIILIASWKNSQLARFLTWHILTVFNSVQWLLTKWPCIFEFNIIISIGSIYEQSFILILIQAYFLSWPTPLSRFICNINVGIWGRAIAVQHNVIWSVYPSRIIYNPHNIYLYKSIIDGCFPDFNLLFHPPKCTT